jgi:hypothetical protein
VSIENRTLEPGTKLVARYKKRDYTAEVVQTEDGVRYRLNGTDYKSPSAAGSAVMGGNACNGWRFWSVEGEGTASSNGDAKKSRKPVAAVGASRRSGKAKKQAAFKRLDDGSYWCSGCQDAFTAPAGVEPIGCPQGHEPA